MNDILLDRISRVLDLVERWLPEEPGDIDWTTDIAALWQHHAFGGRLVSVTPRDHVTLDDLVGVDRQVQFLLDNTRAFLKGLPANNALLWGSRGSGKSSVVRALLNTLSPEGLRLIQIDRHDLASLPILVEHLRHTPRRFIVYCDDLSFEGSDDAYKGLKSALDGTLTGPPDNVLFYATSNRRHLLPETFSDNAQSRVVDGEIHHGEAVEEKISLADRFGLWLGFYPFNQDSYLSACAHWTRHLGGAEAWDAQVEEEAIRFATLRGGRSGRAAWQFACQWVGKQALSATQARQIDKA